MKTLIIYNSVHQGNTKKIAERMGKVLKAKLVKPDEIGLKEILNYDLIGFGSGIYMWRHHRSLLDFVNRLPDLKDKRVFVFSTAGKPDKLSHRRLKEKLESKGADIVGEFSCEGLDKFGPLRLIGGINKGRPNQKDLKNAEGFAKKLIKKM
ncbi:MAG: flavodoxin [Candidatus Aenigmarchaeota archaeon CG_4_10_14_0_8_um_filter_37_24]|nr:flavodoxin [Candidatus Aenigmarchaeota archaeon]OIN87913.1 MAG: flavodoxin [Candidatus Aenigmarchaeota archaeon CG1_02_38_14]PIV67965.1 MAG: flavodoxin [Candidatus Aenigmarchaeota archaeon CG01_land_8_20_14_3_00_37_9]PIW41044.1 MAG: flavodoxin [Candidatus Aenigmarchaeota archaeon CG15_BIG_FIL_POST_REV_8_21_14_020_37_27]PIX51182.1 MAG: flavodoxin [Candidatus Aenigmarchaeota archaeon CG_4_8_14_3_um_filter_37_24]PIY34876.1 MAG: flavodoxin [Candidatus Aenigmarchaeota archaeon CG_4_10_14_3_um_fi